jgi:hypothetical protein
MMAADANRSNSITTSDIVALRKLILGYRYCFGWQYFLAFCSAKSSVYQRDQSFIVAHSG